MIIAVDGPAASGKGTVSRKIADLYGFAYLDTGLLYRAIARDVTDANGRLQIEDDALKAAQSLDFASLDDENLRLTGVGEAASIVARHPAVRAELLSIQQNFANRLPGAVLDGRDIGTVVCPNADAKLYVTADAEVRAERRFLELARRGERVTREGVLEMILQRDARDTERVDSPMRPAEDAMLLDTTKLDISQSFDAAVELIKRKIGLPGT
ncbi:MAG: (d)CMP kinase [Pseudomonadota bacterium]